MTNYTQDFLGFKCSLPAFLLEKKSHNVLSHLEREGGDLDFHKEIWHTSLAAE